MKIVLYGGTFDPVHEEHVKLVRGALKELAPDKLIVLPSFVPPHKADATVCWEHRFNMAKLAFSFDERVEVSDYEILRGGNSYTYLTVEHFRELYPDDELFFLIGGDSFFSFDTWRHPEIIAEKAGIVVVSRGEFTEKLITCNAAFEKKYGYKAKILSFTGDGTTSTYIRYCLMLGCAAENVPEKVLEYIKEHELYKGDEKFEYVKQRLKEKRRYHTAGVIECALNINGQVGLDRDKVITAALLHDVAKYTSLQEFPEFTVPEDMPASVVHAFLGEYIARTVLGITDEDVLSAIKYHTTGRPNMSSLEKVIYTADLLERNRNYFGVNKLRKAVEEDFEKGFRECIVQGYKHLKQSLQAGGVYYLTELACEYYENN